MIGFIRELAPEAPQITFFNWMVWGFIAMVLYFLVTYFVLWKMFPADVKHIDGAQEFIQEHKNALGKWTRAQKNTLIAFIVAVVLWVFPGILNAIQGISPDAIDPDLLKNYNKHFPEAVAAMATVSPLHTFPMRRVEGANDPHRIETWQLLGL